VYPMRVLLIIFCILSYKSSLAIDSKKQALSLKNMVVTDAINKTDLFKDRPYSGNIFVIQEIEEQGIESVQEVTGEIPNFNFFDAGRRSLYSILTVRGLTNTAIFSEPSVVFYIDDVPYGNTSSYSNRLSAVESIEVYRGSHGHLFGKNSYGGLFNVRSKKPENKINTHFSASYARFNSWTTEGHVDGALIKDKLFFSLGGSYAHSDGYMHNSFLNNTPDEENHISGHGSLTWRPSANWNIKLMLNGDDFKDANPHYSALSSDDPLEIQSDENGKLEQHSNMQALRIHYQHNSLKFLSVTSRRDWQLDPLFIDFDFSPTPFLTSQLTQRQTQWTQEFRISGKETDINWSVGAFFSTEDNEFSRDSRLFGSTVSSQNSRLEAYNYALFSNLTFNISNRLRLHTGLRFDYVDKKVDRKNRNVADYKERRDFFHISPKLSLDYLITNDFMLYFSTGLNFKPGGFSVETPNSALSKYNSETLWASELGLKSAWLNDRIQANLALFYYEINDYQVERLVTPINYSILNAEKTTSYGLEMDASIELLPGLQLETAFGYTHIRFDKFIDPVTKADLSGNQPPYTPEKNLSIAAQYKHPSGYFMRSEWVWTDTTYFNDGNSDIYKRDDYSTLSARVGYQQPNYSFFLFAENLTNTEYYSYIVTSKSAAPAKPRSLGVKISFDF